MTRGTRYFFFVLIYVLTFMGLIIQSYTFFVVAVILAVALGMWIEKVDNQRTEKFKHYNTVHNYHH